MSAPLPCISCTLHLRQSKATIILSNFFILRHQIFDHLFLLEEEQCHHAIEFVFPIKSNQIKEEEETSRVDHVLVAAGADGLVQHRLPALVTGPHHRLGPLAALFILLSEVDEAFDHVRVPGPGGAVQRRVTVPVAREQLCLVIAAEMWWSCRVQTR